MTIQQSEQRTQGGLDTYLADLGLGEAQIAKMVSVLQEGLQEGSGKAKGNGHSNGNGNGHHKKERALAVAERGQRRTVGAKLIRLYIAEEQQILREAYQAFFENDGGMELVGSSEETSAEALIEAVADYEPDILLVGVKTLQPAIVEKLETVRESTVEVGIVLLSASYDVHGIKALREFSRGATAGCAYLLKHTIDTVEQLTQVINSVAQGRIILDPSVMEGMISSGEPNSRLLKELSPKELEVLGWMAKGYRNDTIAAVLSREPKTVERHINDIYSKLDSVAGSKHPRVNSILMYLQATGLMPTQQFDEE